MRDIKPWLCLKFDDIDSQWWKHNKIIDMNNSKIYKTFRNSLAHIIIQDENMSGIFYYFSTWYNNDPNRYAIIIYNSYWPFNKPFLEMNNDEIVYLTDFPDVLFIVHCGEIDQPTYCKNFESIHNK